MLARGIERPIEEEVEILGNKAEVFLSLVLRHTQVQTTARYAHLARDSIQNAAARITRSIGGNLSTVQETDNTTR